MPQDNIENAKSSELSSASDGIVETVYDAELNEHFIFRNAWLPNIQLRQLSVDVWFGSNQAGDWLLLTKQEMECISSVALSLPLYEKLEKKNLVLTKANVSSFHESYRNWCTPHFRHPVSHLLVSTLRCNLSCLYCHAAVVPAEASKSYDMDLETGRKIADFACQSLEPYQSFEFQGGESLLNRDLLFNLIPYIKDRYSDSGRPIDISIQTNGTLLSDKWMSFFNKYEVSVGSSLDGPDDLNDQQRVFNNGTPSAAIVKRKTTNFSVPILPTITKNSLGRWQEIIDMQLNNGHQSIVFHAVYPINSAKTNWEKVGMSVPEFLSMYEQVVDYLYSKWTDGYYPMERRFILAAQKLRDGRDVDFADFGNPCGMVHTQIVYHTNGDIYTCDEGRDFEEFKVGNVATDEYDSVVFGERMRKLKSLSIPNDVECQSCAYRAFCSACPVYERAVTGELVASRAGTFHCQETKFVFDKVLKWVSEKPGFLHYATATCHF